MEKKNQLKKFLGKIFFFGETLSPAAAAGVIVLVSILARVTFVVVLGGGFNAIPGEPDGLFYLEAARVLAEHGVYGLNENSPIMGAPPGQPAFLAILVRLFGETVPVIRLAHILASTLTALIAYFLGKELYNRAVGFWSGLLAALDPAQIYLAGTFLSETVFTCLLMGGLLLLEQERKKNSLWRAALAGLCFGLAGLTRNQGWPYPFIVLAGSLVSRGKLIHWRSASLAVLFTMLTILPWTLRNQAISGEWVFINTNGGLTLWSGNNPKFTWRQPMPMSDPVYTAPAGLSPTQLDAYYQKKAIRWIQAHPTQFLLNGVRKVLLFFHFDPMPQREGNTLLFRLAGIFPYGLLIPFILLGLFSELKNPEAWLLLLMVFFFILVSFIFFGDSRARAPIQPLLYLFAMNWFSKWLTPQEA